MCMDGMKVKRQMRSALSNNRKMTLSTFQVSSVTRKLIIIASHLNRFPCAVDYNCKVFRKLVIVDIRIVEGSVVVEGVLPVDIAGSCEALQCSRGSSPSWAHNL